MKHTKLLLITIITCFSFVAKGSSFDTFLKNLQHKTKIKLNSSNQSRPVKDVHPESAQTLLNIFPKAFPLVEWLKGNDGYLPGFEMEDFTPEGIQDAIALYLRDTKNIISRMPKCKEQMMLEELETRRLYSRASNPSTIAAAPTTSGDRDTSPDLNFSFPAPPACYQRQEGHSPSMPTVYN